MTCGVLLVWCCAELEALSGTVHKTVAVDISKVDETLGKDVRDIYDQFFTVSKYADECVTTTLYVHYRCIIHSCSASLYHSLSICVCSIFVNE